MKVRVPTRSLAFATLLFVPALALAQPPGPPGGGPPDDGPPNAPPSRAGRPGTPRGNAPGRMNAMVPDALMEALDKNHDGTLSADEIRKASEALRTLDRDRDGRIDRSELQPRLANRGGRANQGRRGPGGGGPGGFGPGGGGPGGFGPGGGGPGGFGPGGGGPGGFGPGGGGPGGFGPGGPRGMGRRPELGDVLPPFVRNELQLNGIQQQNLQALEAEVRTKLGVILTPEQVGQCQNALRRGPGGPPGQGPRGGPGGPGGPPGDDGGGPLVRPGRPD